MELNFANIDHVANHTFDYVIVGGGIAGSVLASRLSENSNNRILLLEAGKGRINDPLIDTPSGGIPSIGTQFGNPDYDWFFQTAPQKDLKGRSMIWSRGKGLGGSSLMNQMVWTRPGISELNAWESLGNPGWGYKDLIPYIQKVEKFHPPSSDVIQAKLLSEEQPWFGTSGPIPLSFSEVLTGMEEIVRTTAVSQGIPAINNAPLGEYTGLWSCPATMDPEKLERSTAFKILWKDNSKSNPYPNEKLTAEGVEFIFRGEKFVVHSAKEVILSAGALKSPQILELSGIGRSDILSPLGIHTLVELPGVGENLQDHYNACPLVLELRPEVEYRTLDLLSDPVQYQKYDELYKNKQHGLLSYTNTDLLFIPLQTLSSKVEELIALHEKDLAERIANMDANTPTSKGLKEQLIIQLERLKNHRSPEIEIVIIPMYLDFSSKPETGKLYLSIPCAIVGGRSRGSAHITSTDPFVSPQFDANALEYPLDLEILTEAFKFTRRLKDCEPLKSIIAKEASPGDNVQTDEEIRERIKDTLNTMWHTSGTLAMLPREKGGVVDSSLKVYGTSNVRVCDLSISPLQGHSHTQCITYAIAEKAADIILGRV